MNKSGKIILVTGATGQQGGAVARQLLKDGWTVRAFVRDPNKQQARELAKAGATLVEGDLSDRGSIDRALKGCYGLFSVQIFSEEGVEGEIRQGNQLADAAKAAGIKHTVYTSVAASDRHTGIPFFESKHKIEQHLKSIALPATIIRPAFFMENFDTMFHPKERQGTWILSLALKADKPLQLIAVEDIGALATWAFNHPEESIGKTIELAGDELTPQQITTIWSRISGKPIQFEETPIDQVRKHSKDYATMFEWFNKHGYKVDIKSLRTKLPQLHKFEAWLNSKHGALATSDRR